MRPEAEDMHRAEEETRRPAAEVDRRQVVAETARWMREVRAAIQQAGSRSQGRRLTESSRQVVALSMAYRRLRKMRSWRGWLRRSAGKSLCPSHVTFQPRDKGSLTSDGIHLKRRSSRIKYAD